MKTWALMWYGVDESACYGIVSQKKLAKEWESRSDENQAVEFSLNEMPKLEQWRDDKMFPLPAPPKAGTIQRTMYDYMNNAMVKALETNFKFVERIK